MLDPSPGAMDTIDIFVGGAGEGWPLSPSVSESPVGSTVSSPTTQLSGGRHETVSGAALGKLRLEDDKGRLPLNILSGKIMVVGETRCALYFRLLRGADGEKGLLKSDDVSDGWER